jgi:hypothetical protein
MIQITLEQYKLALQGLEVLQHHINAQVEEFKGLLIPAGEVVKPVKTRVRAFKELPPPVVVKKKLGRPKKDRDPIVPKAERNPEWAYTKEGRVWRKTDGTPRMRPTFTAKQKKAMARRIRAMHRAGTIKPMQHLEVSNAA